MFKTIYCLPLTVIKLSVSQFNIQHRVMHIRDKLNEKIVLFVVLLGKYMYVSAYAIHSYWKYSDEIIFFVLSIIYNKFACLIIHFPLNS